MAEIDVLEIQLRAMRDDINDVRRAMEKVADALERLARLEERHATVAGALDRAFSAIAKIEQRLSAVELAQPVQKLTSGWVIHVLWAAGGMLVIIVGKKMGVL